MRQNLEKEKTMIAILLTAALASANPTKDIAEQLITHSDRAIAAKKKGDEKVYNKERVQVWKLAEKPESAIERAYVIFYFEALENRAGITDQESQAILLGKLDAMSGHDRKLFVEATKELVSELDSQ